MLTNNWRNAVLGNIFNIATTSNKNTAGAEAQNSNAVLFSGRKFVIGTGSTPPQIDDYKMESEIDSSKYIASPSVSNGDGYSEELGISISCTITNKSSETLSVSEIGLIGDNKIGINYTYLFAREAFDTPIVIAPGETKSFVLKLF